MIHPVGARLGVRLPAWNARTALIVERGVSIILDWLVPSRRHREEERHRLEWTRDESGQGDPHHGPIDLDSGVVTIKASAGEDADPDAGSDGADPDLSEPTGP